MKVAVLTMAKPFQPDKFIDVFVSVEAADKFVKGISQYAKKDKVEGSWVINDAGDVSLYFVSEREVRE